MPWLTGNNAAAGTICRRVLIPADINLRAAVSGALTALTEVNNWEQFGTLTPEQCAELMSAMYDAFLADDCDCPEDTRMIGTIVAYATASAPTGCLPCDGESYLIADYPALAAALDAAFIVSGTHFKTPDLRGRTLIGAGTGIGLTTRAVGATGGAENHTLSIAEMPAHNHTQVGHSHTVTDAGHSHGISDAGHSHGITDPGHTHTIPARNATADGTGLPRLANSTTSNASASTASASTGVSVNNNVTGVSVNSNVTGVSVNSAVSGIVLNSATPTINNRGGDTAHNNMPPFLALKYAIVATP